jgi:alkylresorcinol/alkylpyrone synthase
MMWEMVDTRLGARSTAVPGEPVSTESVWAAVCALRGGRFGGLLADAPGRRHLAEPLEFIMRTRSISEQTQAYLRHARRLSLEAASAALETTTVDRERIGMVICISCTGFVLPSLDAELIPRLGLRRDTVRLPIAELGCGGGVAGLARAHDFVRAHPDRAVLTVAVELPSLTFQPDDRSTDNLIAAMVFGDGAGAAVLEADDGRPGWRIVRTGTSLLPEGARHLGYELRDGGLTVVLSRELPRVVESALPCVVGDFLAADGMRIEDVDLVMAHPGGPRIFRAIENALHLSPDRLQTSRDAFAAYANTSSAGIFFVLQGLPAPTGSSTALALAFGPGLSIEMALLRAQA